MTTLSTLICASLIVLFSLVHLHVESLSLCTHHFLEQSLRLSTQSLNTNGNKKLRRNLCSNQTRLQFEKNGDRLASAITQGELKDHKIQIKAQTVWGKNEDQ